MRDRPIAPSAVTNMQHTSIEADYYTITCIFSETNSCSIYFWIYYAQTPFLDQTFRMLHFCDRFCIITCVCTMHATSNRTLVEDCICNTCAVRGRFISRSMCVRIVNMMCVIALYNYDLFLTAPHINVYRDKLGPSVH